MIRLSRAFDFVGADGHRLAGRLDLPAGPPLATALFAHCFTCSKDYHASARISRGLAEHGFAVLRFDFTGLGNSDGDFANTDFSSNVADLVAAARALGAELAPPKLLLGHSLGGAAVLKAAAALDSVAAVVAIAAPASPAHLRHLIAGREEELARDGKVQVTMGAHSFPITADFLKDIEGQRMEEAIAGLGRPLLLLHDPADTVVSIGNAERILASARHPKSLVTLDGAGHLLARREDAQYATDIIARWARRTLKLEPAAARTLSAREEAGDVTVTETGEGRFANLVEAGPHLFPADEPVAVGGNDSGPGPYQLLLAALGTCTSMTVRMYAEHKGLPVERISVRLRHEKVPAPPGVTTENAGNRLDRIDRELTVDGPLTADQRDRLLEIADRCPVHRTLMSRPEIRTRLAGADSP